MTISPIKFYPQSQKSSNNTRANASCTYIKQKKGELPKIPSEYLKAQILPNETQYIYKPLASAKPIFKPIGYYDNIDLFSKHYTDKINSQLLVPTKEDIESLIKRIKSKTNADEQEIKNVLYNLGKFCNYDSMALIDKFIQDNNIKSFGLPYNFFDNDTYDFSSNSAIDYLIKNKHFLQYSNCSDNEGKIGYILDDSSLSQLENYKNSTNQTEREIYQKFVEDVKNDKYCFINIKGWEIKTKANGYKGANFLTGSGYIEDLAVETIKRLQKGESEDRIYYSDFEERLDNLFDDEETRKHAIITGFQGFELNNPTNETILNLLSPISASSDYINAVIKSYLEIKGNDVRTQAALLKYLDEMTRVYSIDSLAVALKKMGKNIESMLRIQGFSKENTSYIIPIRNKSYSVITSMYSKLNDIKTKNINSTFNITEENQKKAKVILDDLSASGTSESKNCLDLRINYRMGKLPVIYAPVVLCNHVEDYVTRPDASYPGGYCFDKYIFDLSKATKLTCTLLNNDMKFNFNPVEDELKKHIENNYKLLNLEDFKILTYILFHGYDANALCVAFPYMIPDNASDIAGLILRNILAVANDATNKTLDILHSNRNNDHYKYNYEDLIKIIQLINERYFNKK